MMQKLPPTHRCHLCGCSSPAVRCEKCSNLIFCLSCDDMYHRHPKRHDHVRKLVNVAPMPPPRPPPKTLDAHQAPVPPPRRKKPEHVMRPPIEKKPELPKKQFPLKFGSLKRFIPGNNSQRIQEPVTRKDSMQSLPQRNDSFKREQKGSAFTMDRNQLNKPYEQPETHFQPLSRHNLFNNNSSGVFGYADQDPETSENSTSDVDEEIRSLGNHRDSYSGSVSHEGMWEPGGHPDPRLQTSYLHKPPSPMHYPMNTFPGNNQDMQMPFGYRRQNLKQHSNSVCDLSGQMMQQIPLGYSMPQHVQSMADIHVLHAGGMMAPSMCGCRPDWIGPDAFGLWHPPVHCPIHSSAMELIPLKPHNYMPYRESPQHMHQSGYPYSQSPSLSKLPPRPPSVSAQRYEYKQETTKSPPPENTRELRNIDKTNFETDNAEAEKKPCHACSKNQPEKQQRSSPLGQLNNDDYLSRSTDKFRSSAKPSESNNIAVESTNTIPVSTWQCRHCTYFNVPGTKVCVICCKTTGIGDPVDDFLSDNQASVPSTASSHSEREKETVSKPITNDFSQTIDIPLNHKKEDMIQSNQVITSSSDVNDLIPNLFNNINKKKMPVDSGTYGSIKRLDSNLSVLKASRNQLKDDGVYEDLDQKNIKGKSIETENNVDIAKLNSDNRRTSNFSQQMDDNEFGEDKVSPPLEKGLVEDSSEKKNNSLPSTRSTTTSDNISGPKIITARLQFNSSQPAPAPRVVSQGTSPPPQSISTQTSRDSSPEHLNNSIIEPVNYMRRVSSQMSLSSKPTEKRSRFFNHQKYYNQSAPLKRAASLHFGGGTPIDSPWAAPIDTHMSRAPSCTSLAGDYKYEMESSPVYRDDSPPRNSFFEPQINSNQKYPTESYFGQRKNSLIDVQRNSRKDYYLSLEELIEKRRQATIKAQGLELVSLLREAEKYNFTADDLQVAINHCGSQNPLKWLQDNWRNMIETVVTLATNYGHDKKENDIGIISNAEAKECLHLHKGNIWAAVTECVEQRQKKFMEVQRNGNFCREEVVAALTANQGNISDALVDLNKSTLKPFLMRIWGPPVGVENEEGVSWDMLNQERHRWTAQSSPPFTKNKHSNSEKKNFDDHSFEEPPIFHNEKDKQALRQDGNSEDIDYEDSTYYPISDTDDDFELMEFKKVDDLQASEEQKLENQEEPEILENIPNSYEDLNISPATVGDGREDIYYDALAEEVCNVEVVKEREPECYASTKETYLDNIIHSKAAQGLANVICQSVSSVASNFNSAKSMLIYSTIKPNNLDNSNQHGTNMQSPEEASESNPTKELSRSNQSYRTTTSKQTEILPHQLKKYSKEEEHNSSAPEDRQAYAENYLIQTSPNAGPIERVSELFTQEFEKAAEAKEMSKKYIENVFEKKIENREPIQTLENLTKEPTQLKHITKLLTDEPNWLLDNPTHESYDEERISNRQSQIYYEPNPVIIESPQMLNGSSRQPSNPADLPNENSKISNNHLSRFSETNKERTLAKESIQLIHEQLQLLNEPIQYNTETAKRSNESTQLLEEKSQSYKINGQTHMSNESKEILNEPKRLVNEQATKQQYEPIFSETKPNYLPTAKETYQTNEERFLPNKQELMLEDLELKLKENSHYSNGHQLVSLEQTHDSIGQTYVTKHRRTSNEENNDSYYQETINESIAQSREPNTQDNEPNKLSNEHDKQSNEHDKQSNEHDKQSNEQRKQNNEQRKQNNEQRKQFDESIKQHEEPRKQPEESRKQPEEPRKQPEESRKQPEESRKQPEESRKQPEESRKQPEESRKQPEESRKQPEETRKQFAESIKQPEEPMKQPEESRKQPEESRKQPEESRKQPEESRKQLEEPRKQSEEPRKQPQESRKQPEESRKQPEEPRKQFTEPRKQFTEPIKQSDEPRQQFIETRKQSDEPQKQFDEPRQQSNEPRQQSDEPRKQSDEPRKQSDEPRQQSNEPMQQSDESQEFDEPRKEYNEPTEKLHKPTELSIHTVESTIDAHIKDQSLPIQSPGQLEKTNLKNASLPNHPEVIKSEKDTIERNLQNNATEKGPQGQHPLLANVQTTFQASSKSSRENDTNRLVRKFLAEGKLPSYEQAEVAAKLVDLKFDENDAIYAAQECGSLYMAVSYLQQDCELCAGRFPMSKMISMLNCIHRCCIICAKDYFTLKIKEGSILDAVCPFCSEPNLRDENAAPDYFNNLDILLKNLVKKDVHELYQRKLRDLALMNDPNFRWCNKCSSGFIADPNRKRLMCPDCKDITCAICKKPWEHQHEGITCSQFSEWKKSNDPEHQLIGLEKYLAENGIDCPKCKFKYDLAKGGCMHFTCTQCKFEFCSGCGKPFRMAKKCGLTERCEKLGLHAHHPRNCLFYLRDKDPKNLQSLLQQHEIQFDTELQLNEASDIRRHQCPVLEQKEMMDGNKDAICGREVEEGHAGLCLNHWLEYLGGLIWQNNLDTIDLLSEDDLENLLRGEGQHLPPRPYGTLLEEYFGQLKKLDPAVIMDVGGLQQEILRHDQLVPIRDEGELEEDYWERLVQYVAEKLPLT